MRVFHYTHIDKWEDIETGSWENKNTPGLATGNRIGQTYIEAYNSSAVFALLEAIPNTWTDNPHFRHSWSSLKRHVGKLLLEIDIDSEKDPVFVIDRAHVEGYIYRDIPGIPEKYLHPSLEEAEKAYLKSKIPLHDYRD